MATIVQISSHLCRYFVVVELKYNNEVIPSTGYETHYDEIIIWCTRNISNKWYSGKMQQRCLRGTRFEDVVGVAIFNFENYNDKAHFILKWL